MSKYSSAEQQASYGVGRQMAQQLASPPFDGFDNAAALAGFTDTLEGRDSQVDAESINQAYRQMQTQMQAKQAADAKVHSAAGEQFLADNARREEVTVTASGLQYEVLTAGTGDTPRSASTVRTHYHGTLIDGTVFDSSYERGEPAEFPVNGVIAGWTEALQLMQVGAKWRLYLPYQLAYGERGAGGAIGPYATLVFDVELLAIVG